MLWWSTSKRSSWLLTLLFSSKKDKGIVQICFEQKSREGDEEHGPADGREDAKQMVSSEFGLISIPAQS